MKNKTLHCEWLEKKDFFVADKKTLLCEKSSDFLIKGPYEVLSEKDFSFHLLHLNSISQKKVKLEVTSYKTGEHLLKDISLKTVSGKIDLKIDPFKVSSVLKKDSKPQLFFPLKKIYPFSLILFLSILGIVLFSFLAWLFMYFSKKRDLKNKAKKFHSPLSPLKEFELKLYELRSHYESLLFKGEKIPLNICYELKKIVQTYLSRLFELSVFDLSNEDLKKILMKYQKNSFLKTEKLIFSMFKELDYFLDKNPDEKKVFWLFDEINQKAQLIHRKIEDKK